MDKVCRWANYKGLWHKECYHFLTTTMHGELNYTSWQIPDDRICPDCGGFIEEDNDRQFGRTRKRMQRTE